MMDNEVLKYSGHRPRSIHVLAMLMILVKHLSSFMIAFRCFHEVQSSPGVNKLLYLMMVLLNFLLENRGHLHIYFDRNSSKFRLTWQFCTELNVCSAYYKLLISMHGWPLKINTFIVGSLYFLTQFMRSHGWWFFDAISWILSLKNKCFIFLTTPLKVLQSLIILEDL